MLVQRLNSSVGPLNRFFKVLNSGLFNLALLTTFGSGLIEFVPFRLPALHGLFRGEQLFTRAALDRCNLVFPGLGFCKAHPQISDLLLICVQIVLHLRQVRQDLIQVSIQLAVALILELNTVFNTCDFRTMVVVQLLDLIQLIRQVGQLRPLGFDFCIDTALLGNPRILLDGQAVDGIVLGLYCCRQRPAAKPKQTGFEFTLFFLQLAVSLGRLGLALQVSQLPL